MAARVASVAFEGIEARRVDVEVQAVGGFSAFVVVGLADKAVGEARDRVRAAFAGLGLALPPRRLVANLAPADLPKEGNHYDLPIALALMATIPYMPKRLLRTFSNVRRPCAASSLRIRFAAGRSRHRGRRGRVPTAMNYFLYCRKSTEDEDRQVLSLQSQVNEAVRAFGGPGDIKIIDRFVEAMSAKRPGRPVFGEMLSRLENGEAEGVIAWAPDRLARNSVDGGSIIYLLDRGVIRDLKFVTYTFENNSQGKFMLQIMFGQAPDDDGATARRACPPARPTSRACALLERPQLRASKRQ